MAGNHHHLRFRHRRVVEVSPSESPSESESVSESPSESESESPSVSESLSESPSLSESLSESPSESPEVDEQAVLLLHCDGPDTSPLFPDSALGGSAPHTTLAQNDCQVDTAQKQFGTGSMYVDGTGDRLNITDGLTDFDFGSGLFTIELWAWLNTGLGTNRGLISKGGGNNVWNDTDGHQWLMMHADDNKVYFFWNTGGGTNNGVASAAGIDLTGGFHHLAVSQDATNIRLFHNGTQVGIQAKATINEPTTRDKMRIADFPSDDLPWFGWIDEPRVLLRAEYTANFTPAGPFSPYS